MEVGVFSVLYLFFIAIAILRGGNAYNNNDIEKNWKSVLPNTVMPKPLKDLIQPPGGKINFQDVVVARPDDNDDGSWNIGYGPVSSDSWKKLTNMKETTYFFEEDVHEGKVMTLNFDAENGAPFVPRHVADSLPFATKKLQQILKQFAVKAESKEAKGIKETIMACEQPGIKGERRRCATSLESMVDFIVSEFGTTNVKVRATEVEGKAGERQRYRVVGVKKLGEDDSVICHKQYYGYAVYYCHKIEATKTYGVSLVGDKESKVKASVVCHFNTADWNPQHVAFKVLNVKPGAVPICHFLARESLVWLAN